MNLDQQVKNFRFRLDVRAPFKTAQIIDVIDHVTIGSDPRNDIILSAEDGIKPKQFLFQTRGDSLVGISYSSNSNQNQNQNQILLNQLPMANNQQYLIENGDVITLNEISITVSFVSSHLPKSIDSRIKNDLTLTTEDQNHAVAVTTKGNALKSLALKVGSIVIKPKKE